MQTQNFRQGDVILQSVSPNAYNGSKLLHLVLAEGEVTGHKHQITDGQAELYRNYSEQHLLFLRVLSETATLTHEEHKPIKIPQGTWIVRIQREYQPQQTGYIVESRNVID